MYKYYYITKGSYEGHVGILEDSKCFNNSVFLILEVLHCKGARVVLEANQCVPIHFGNLSQTNGCDIHLVNFNEEKGVTTIKWKDGTLTQVRVQKHKGDVYDPETGMAMCIAKKALGNKGNYNDVFKKWLPEYAK